MASIILLLLPLLGCISFVLSQNCKWLHPNQEYLNTQILHCFDTMIPPQDLDRICQNDTFNLPNIEEIYNSTEVEGAAKLVRDTVNQTKTFYMEHHEHFGHKKETLERLLILLHYQTNQLQGCISQTAENHILTRTISEQFRLMEDILNEQDNSQCAWDYINDEIRRNLNHAFRLSSRLRKHLLKTNS